MLGVIKNLAKGFETVAESAPMKAVGKSVAESPIGKVIGEGAEAIGALATGKTINKPTEVNEAMEKSAERIWPSKLTKYYQKLLEGEDLSPEENQEANKMIGRLGLMFGTIGMSGAGHAKPSEAISHGKERLTQLKELMMDYAKVGKPLPSHISKEIIDAMDEIGKWVAD